MRCFNFTWILLLALGTAACTQVRKVTFDAKPPDTLIYVDNLAPRPAGFTQEIKFTSPKETHTIVATRSGYKDQTIVLNRDDKKTVLDFQMKPVSRKLALTVSPVPGVISVDGNTLSPTQTNYLSIELEFFKDDKDQWTPRTITASRPGYQPAQITVNYTDPMNDYILAMQPKRKDVSIITTPPGATVTIDGEAIAGLTPLVAPAVAFPVDSSTGGYLTRKVVLSKPGYDPVTYPISWDDNRAEYKFDIPPKSKVVRFITEPSGASVTINGHVLPPSELGQPTAKITFPPVDDKGTLPVYTATITKKNAQTEWYPVDLPVSWENGKQEYSVTLKEITTKMVPLTEVSVVRNSEGVWEVKSRETEALGQKNPEEPGRDSPVRIYSAPEGASIGTIAVAPDGSHIMFTVITGRTKDDNFRSKIMTISPDGTGGTQELTDGKSLDVMPSYSPDGDSIVFCSNRGGKRLDIWQKPINGDGGQTQLTRSFDEEDLWPMVDAAPKQRLFYEARIDSSPDSLLYMNVVGTTIRSDLTKIPVSEPRISPKADAIIFASVNEKTGNREIYKASDKGSQPQDITNFPEADSYDPAWSRDGNLIAFTSDRGLDGDKRHNPDIWIVDLAHPDKPKQETFNGSVDDCPAWDPSGNYIYFRSNRGGGLGDLEDIGEFEVMHDG